MEKVYTPQEVADILRISYGKVLDLIKKGELKPLSSMRHYIITETELSRYLRGE